MKSLSNLQFYDTSGTLHESNGLWQYNFYIDATNSVLTTKTYYSYAFSIVATQNNLSFAQIMAWLRSCNTTTYIPASGHILNNVNNQIYTYYEISGIEITESTSNLIVNSLYTQNAEGVVTMTNISSLSKQTLYMKNAITTIIPLL